jgi:general secretion pathway protein J
LKPFASAPRRPDDRAGFTLIEALAALTVAVLLLAAVAQLSALVLHNWRRGQAATDVLEMLTTAHRRLTADLGSALPIGVPGSTSPMVLFRGHPTSMLFVAATGWRAGDRGLELVSVDVIEQGDTTYLVRRRGPAASLAAQLSDPVVLVKGRMLISFAYNDRVARRHPVWDGRPSLPASVEVQVRTRNGESVMPAPMVIQLPVNLAVECLDSTTRQKPQRCALEGAANSTATRTGERGGN